MKGIKKQFAIVCFIILNWSSYEIKASIQAGYETNFNTDLSLEDHLRNI